MGYARGTVPYAAIDRRTLATTYKLPVHTWTAAGVCAANISV
jgi:hypothetical protein